MKICFIFLVLLYRMCTWDVFLLHGVDVMTSSFLLTPVTPYDNAGRHC